MRRFEITLEKARHHMEIALQAGKVPLLVGPPGIGKTEIVAQVAAEGGYTLLTRDCASLDYVDLAGIPVPRGRDVIRTIPPFLRGVVRADVDENGDPAVRRVEGKFIFLLDELGKTPRQARAGLLEFVRTGRLDDFQIGSEDRIVATTNRLEDAADEGVMSSALVNRMVVLNVRPDLEGWMVWMASERGTRAHMDVARFVAQNPHLLHDLSPLIERGESNFPSPRSWTNLGDLLAGISPDGRIDADTVTILGVGTCGETAGQAIGGWWRSRRVLPLPEDILAGKASPVDDMDHGDAVAVVTACLRLVREEGANLAWAEKEEKLGPKLENLVRFLDDCDVDQMVYGFMVIVAMRRFRIGISGMATDGSGKKIAPRWHEVVANSLAPVLKRRK